MAKRKYSTKYHGPTFVAGNYHGMEPCDLPPPIPPRDYSRRQPRTLEERIALGYYVPRKPYLPVEYEVPAAPKKERSRTTNYRAARPPPLQPPPPKRHY